MRNTLRYSFATAIAAGLAFVPATAAFADATTSGSGGVGSGNQIIVPVDIEAGLCGNSLAVLGISKATCTQVSKVLYETSGKGGASTDGSGGVASGNQIIVPVDAAIDACGNAVAVGGVSKAECLEVVEVLEEESADGTYSTDGSGGVASGNQIIVPVDAAINICGNSVAILGAASSKCTTIINIIQAAPENEGSPEATTDGSGGVASGNQVVVPVDVATDICGNAVGVLGLAEASCLEAISEKPGEPGKPEEPGEETPETPEKPEEPGGEKPEKPEEPREEDEHEGDDGEDDGGKGDDKPAPPQQAGSELPLTGGALTGLVAAGIAAVGAGGAGLYFARKRKAALATAGEE
ncbi:chaplin [Nocardiopsis lambiniae]|uniref:Chaplin n=1 Tax=Nocardiopsis lambiniae TaxID=3075539 RepID=A0ABU2MGQ7_9ACTN|nr:chaplin [Nocardiopsis sp. DSM 44743]MDT0331890.1 chaplin [Nocardiopsis sp. DSM 44743]